MYVCDFFYETILILIISL